MVGIEVSSVLSAATVSPATPSVMQPTRLPETGFNKKLLPHGRNPMIRDVHFTTPSKNSTESPR